MRVFNDKNNPSSPTRRAKPKCSYCGSTAHKVGSCGHVKGDWALFQQSILPHTEPSNWTNNPHPNPEGGWGGPVQKSGWYKHPSGWSDWYQSCKVAYSRIIAAEERQKAGSNNTPSSRPKSCGFCGQTGHTRRNCTEMQALNERLIKANTHWRKRFYETVVVDMGIACGALVKVDDRQYKNGAWESVHKVGIVTNVNFDEVNMFSFAERSTRRWSKVLNEKFTSPLTISINVNDRTSAMAFRRDDGSMYGVDSVLEDKNGDPLVDSFGIRYGGFSFNSVLSPSEQPLSTEWMEGGQSECVEFVTKKYSLEKLTKWNVISLLENYESKYNL